MASLPFLLLLAVSQHCESTRCNIVGVRMPAVRSDGADVGRSQWSHGQCADADRVEG